MSNLTGYQTPHNVAYRKILGLPDYTGVIYRVQNGPNLANRILTAQITVTDLTPYPSEQLDLTLSVPEELEPGSDFVFTKACEDVPCDTLNYDEIQCTAECVNKS